MPTGPEFALKPCRHAPALQKVAYNLNVGPGYYHDDPMHTTTTGMPTFNADEIHHMRAFAKDPSRPSPSFKSPPR